MKIPFRHHDRNGFVIVRFGVNRGTRDSGFDISGGRFAAMSVAGFPTMRATVSYDGKGYRRFLAWIQIVSHDLHPRGKKSLVVDVPPSLIGFGVPFAAVGDAPTLFDAPATTFRRGRFAAESHLCAVSLIDRDVPIRPLASFAWGYDLRKSGTAARAPRRLGPDAWNARLPFLRRTHRRWSFARAS